MNYEEITGASEVRIKVIGVGGGGISAVNHMIASGIQCVVFIAADTDKMTLARTRAEHVLQLGPEYRKGMGAGGDPDVGRRAAEESIPAIKTVIGEADLVFVVAGMGSGTGSGAAPIIAKIAKEAGALTLGVVTKPFYFQGKKWHVKAKAGIQALLESGDSTIVIPDDGLIQLAPKKAFLIDWLREADKAMYHAVRGVSDLLTQQRLIALDFADVQTVLSGKGGAVMGFGAASGAERAKSAARQALTIPLLGTFSVDNARGALINITSSQDITIEEIADAAGIIQEAIPGDAPIFFSTVFDESLCDEMHVTIILSSDTGE